MIEHNMQLTPDGLSEGEALGKELGSEEGWLLGSADGIELGPEEG